MLETLEPNTGTAVPGEAPPIPDQQVAEPSQQSDDTESRARAQGWVPKDEFRGDETKWKSADEFLKYGEERQPILRERLDHTSRKLAEVEARLAARDDEFRRLERMTSTALQRQRDQLQQSYDNAMREAASLGDVQRYDQLSRDRVQALHQVDTQVSEAAAPSQQQGRPPPLSPDQQAKLDTWLADNRWAVSDPMLSAVARAESDRLAQEAPGMDMLAHLSHVRSFVSSKFPEKFGLTVRAGAAPVESGGRMASQAGPRTKGASDLPAEARKAGESFVKQGLYKNLSEYAKDYWSQD